ncbi:MAG: LD-carboxypeptidase [Alphaproteobacteria bacterium]|nr:LD-carboxypeptidase [Alphaproteobacteria bacterium]
MIFNKGIVNIRVIAPAASLANLAESNRELAETRLKALGFKVSFGQHAFERDMFGSSSVQSRVKDLHDAFQDPDIDLVMAAFGGANSNELLPYIDYDLIKNNKKIFCGFSDITALQNALLKKSELINLYGPCFSHFAMQQGFDYIEQAFMNIVKNKRREFDIIDSHEWSDDKWHKNQDDRHFMQNPGRVVLYPGQAEGEIGGGNIGTLPLLFGTPYMPGLANKILFLEDDGMSIDLFKRNFVSLSQQPDFDKVKGIVLGRFRNNSDFSVDGLREFFNNHVKLGQIPVITGLDFGHTMPYFVFPIGGKAYIDTEKNMIKISL